MDLTSSSGEPGHRAAPPASPAAAAAVLDLDSGTWMRWLVAAALVLLAAHLVVVWSYLGDWRLPIRDKFYFDAENNVPTVFSGFVLLLCAIVLGWIATVVRARALPDPRHWAALGLIFALLAFDELASIHELLINPLRNAMDLPGFLRFPWVIAGVIFVALVGLAYLRFLARLPASTRWLFVLAGFLYVGGAVGMEMVGGYVFETFQENRAEGDKNMVPYMIVMTLEESLEIGGALLFLHACLRHLRAIGAPLRLGLR
jgi:hypothetical protein